MLTRFLFPQHRRLIWRRSILPALPWWASAALRSIGYTVFVLVVACFFVAAFLYPNGIFQTRDGHTVIVLDQ